MEVSVNHSEWGIPEMDLEANPIRQYLHMNANCTLVVGYYPDIKAYVFGHV